MRDLERNRAWMREGTAVFLDAVRRLADDELDERSGLPAWSRRTLIAHVSSNAGALCNLLTWARTGVETPMYASPEARQADIQQTAQLDTQQLRSTVEASAAALDNAMDQLTVEQWQHTVRTAQGRTVPAGQVPWMRVREVWVHAVDLGTGSTTADLPPGAVDTLIEDVLSVFERRGDQLDAVLAPTDRATTWRSGTGTGTGTVAVAGTAADLAGWLTGRLADGSRLRANGDRLPEVPRWL